MSATLKVVKQDKRVGAKMQLQELIGKPVATYPQLAGPLGSKQAADLFSQLLYWWDICDQEVGFYVTLEELSKQTGLTVKQVRGARAKLLNLGVVTITEKRLQHRTYYTVNTEVLFEHIAKCQKGSPEMPKGQSGSDKRAVVEMPKGQSYIEQRLPKTTTKNNTKNITHTADASAQSVTKSQPSAKPKKSSAHSLAVELLTSHGVSEQVASDYMQVRKAKRAGILTETAMNLLANQAKGARLTVEQAVLVCIERNWVGFNADWLRNSSAKPTKPSVKDVPVHTVGGVIQGGW